MDFDLKVKDQARIMERSSTKKAVVVLVIVILCIAAFFITWAIRVQLDKNSASDSDTASPGDSTTDNYFVEEYAEDGE